MNERIKELAKEAGVLADFGEDIKEGRYIISGSYQSMEKFAESIVKECIGIVKQRWIDPDEDVIAEEIKQHFGVKE